MTSNFDQSTGEARSLRILVVDNNGLDRTDHEESLIEWGYTPIVAEGEGWALIEDAKRKAREQRCHAAIVDKRLYDDHDVSDRSGLDLVPHLRPARSIVVTGYGSIPDSRKVNEYGAVMVGKEEGSEAVRIELQKALQDVRRANFTIRPTDWLEKYVIPFLISDERQSVQADEVRDVLAMLFPQARRIYLQNLPRSVPSTPTSTSGLRGSSVVVRVKPENLASSIIKFASPGAIKRERENYDKYVAERIESRRHPQMSGRKRFWNVGAVVYSSLGEDINDISLFHTFYRNHTTDEIAAALRNFFLAVWQPLYAEQSDLPDSLFAAYDRLWARPGSEGYLAAKLADWKKLDKLRSFEDLHGEFPEPRRWLADHSADSSLPGVRQCIVHGDLHGGNFFVDKHSNTWVIDFERTGPGHILADFVELEHDILRQLAILLDLPTLYYLVIGLTMPLSIDLTSEKDPLFFGKIIPILTQAVDKSLRTEVERALTVIHELRKIAVELFRYKSQQEYYWALLLDTLFAVQRLERQVTLEAADEAIKQKELLLASILCQRLKNGQAEWPPADWQQPLPAHSAFQSQKPPSKAAEPVRILLLASDPERDLRLDKEMKAIDRALREADLRDNFELDLHLATEITDLQDTIQRYKPMIVHFCGHGTPTGELKFIDPENESALVSSSAIIEMFRVLRKEIDIRCVVLNACYTEQLAEGLADHIDAVVGIFDEIGDYSARTFSVGFYRGLGYNNSIGTAFELGCNAIDLQNLGDAELPKLIARRADANNLYFFKQEISL